MQTGRREFLATATATATTAALAGCSSLRGPTDASGPERWEQYHRTAGHTGSFADGSVPRERPEVLNRVSLDGVTATSPVGNDAVVAVGDEGGVAVVGSGLDTVRIDLPGRTRVPALSGDDLYATASGEPAVMLRARTDGTVEWRQELTSGSVSAPALADETLYASTSDGHLAVDAETGDVRWRRGSGIGVAEDPLATANLAPAVADETVVFPTAEGVAAVDRGEGTVQWSRGLGRVWSAPAVADGTVYIPVVGRGLFALDLASGDRRWRWDRTPCWATPAVTADRVYAAAGFRPAALDAATGERLWRGPSLNGAVSSGMTTVGETVLTSSHDAGIAALGTDGTERWSVTEGDGSYHTPIAVGSRLAYVQYTTDGPELRFLGTTE